MNGNAVPGSGSNACTDYRLSDTAGIRTLCLLLLLCFVIAKCYLVSPFKVVMHNNGHDDLLFVILANHISHGDWLGPFNSLTLAKLPGYPLWLAMEHMLGLPPLSGEYLVYIAAVTLFYIALVNAGMQPVFTAIALFVLLLSPEFYYTESMRFMRNLLYDCLTLLLISVSLVILQINSARLLLVCTLGYSLVLGFYSILREEFIWILPVHGVFVACFVYVSFKRNRPQPFVRAAIVALLPLVMVLAVSTTIQTINAHYYGIRVLDTQRDGNFPKAMGALQRIEVNSYQKYVPISQEMRLKAYEVSPHFSELRLQLEGNYNSRISTWNSCNEAHVCNDYAAQRVYWDIMYAATNLHNYDTASKAEDFYGAIATEINTACASGRIACASPHESLYPVFHPAMIADVITAAHSVGAGFFYPHFTKDLYGPWWKSKDLAAFDAYQALFPAREIYTEENFMPQESPRRLMGRLVARLWPFIALFALSVAVWVIGTYVHNAKHSTSSSPPDPVIACAVIIILAAIFCRLGVLVVVTATNFRAMEGYMAAMYGLTGLLSVIAFAYGLGALAKYVRPLPLRASNHE